MPTEHAPTLPTIRLTASPLADSPAYAAVSVPLPAGALASPEGVALIHEDGTRLPTQARALVSWPDGSVRWLRLSALSHAAGSAQLVVQPGEPPADAIRVDADGDGLRIATGRLDLQVRAGTSPIAALRFDGCDMLHGEQGASVRVTLADGRSADFRADSAPVIRESGAVRVVCRLDGQLVTAAGEALLKLTLDFTVTAGHETLGIACTFRHETPGVPAYDIDSLVLTLRPGAAATGDRTVFQKNRGMLCLATDIVTRRPVDMRVSTQHSRVFMADTACFEDPETYPEIMPDIMSHTEARLGTRVGDHWLTVVPDDFAEMTPKGLTATDDGITYHILPGWAPTTHLLQGRGRRLSLHLVLTSGTEHPSSADVRARHAAVIDQARARLPLAWQQAHAGFAAESILPAEPAGPRRFCRYLRRLGRMPTVLGMWDYGDTIDSGYSRTYAGNESTRSLAEPPPPRFASGNHHPMMEWSRCLRHEPVWANNEYDAILALGREWLRTDLPAEHLHRLCSFGRHAIEVDWVSYSDLAQLHHGTPAHSADHQRATAYPSHLWAEGLLLYYCLSGDDDALDVVHKQCQFIIDAFSEPGLRKRLWGYSRELGWALLHLATAADYTGHATYREASQELAQVLIDHSLSDDSYEQMTVGAFGMVSIALGVYATWQLNGAPALAAWLERTSRGIGHQIVERGTESTELAMALPYFTAAYHVTGDPSHLEPGVHVLEQLIDTDRWTNPPMEVKPVAMLHRGLATFLGPAHRHDLLASLDYRHYPGPTS